MKRFYIQSASSDRVIAEIDDLPATIPQGFRIVPTPAFVPEEIDHDAIEASQVSDADPA